MNLRTILNLVGLSAVAVSLGLGPASAPAPQLTDLQQNLLLQLSDAEANIQAINKALKLTGYNVGVAYDQIDSSQHASATMDRKGGGPVRWDEFYGKTAKSFGRLNTARNGYWGDARPQQFDFVYQANNDQISRAQQKIASLQENQDALLARRQVHENDQSRLWATLAWNQVKDREIALESICRYALKPAGSQATVLRAGDPVPAHG